MPPMLNPYNDSLIEMFLYVRTIDSFLCVITMDFSNAF